MEALKAIPYPIRVDLIDRAGTRTGFCRCTEEAWMDAFKVALEAAAPFRGTAQAYYEDDPERSLPY